MRAKYTKTNCRVEERKTVGGVLLSHFQGAFLVYAYGLAAAVVTLFGSIVINRMT